MRDTIAAISTAVSASGIGIIRVSGNRAVEIADQVYRSKKKNWNLSDAETHTIHYGHIYDGGEMVDEVLVMLMRAPRTFTGEDTVEIDCHGGVYAMKRVLETVLKQGARIAEPGEFTKRAFLNGRLDLSQAEAVMDVIQSKNQHALNNSIRQLKGSVKQKITEIRQKILYETAYIEAALDDPEHMSLDGFDDRLLDTVEEQKDRIEQLLSTSEDGKMIQEGIRTVIVGKPNAGKSSLLNVLLGEERAIVTEIAGTTRDTLEEYIHMGGVTLRLVDTAGIRRTSDVVESIGVDKALNQAEQADLVLYVADASVPLDESDYQIMDMITGKQAIIILNKSDLPEKVSARELERLTGKQVITVSAKEETGLEELKSQIESMFFQGKLHLPEDVYITNLRHKKLLQEAVESLNQVLDSLHAHMPEDFYSIDLMSAYEALGSILGESVDEDVINEIFHKFCVGK
ncbi:MAG: tRNA uridine-5-carboxymethylaminomethyl(34) synthesis GTPase MnmE [Lachnospiraceae bacterium]|nr:tRNA uridine-5-carboxymethylaminomethyl(34) synthesis GTPase MnmE [Lachnospiraceae bacterium]